MNQITVLLSAAGAIFAIIGLVSDIRGNLKFGGSMWACSSGCFAIAVIMLVSK